jgi:hypothetical protein
MKFSVDFIDILQLQIDRVFHTPSPEAVIYFTGQWAGLRDIDQTGRFKGG